jgi:predicted small lipoprotein YifL
MTKQNMIRSMRRLFSLVLAFVMVFAMTACGTPTPTTAPTQSMQGDPTTAPTTQPTEPTEPPTEPTTQPTEPTTQPTEPTTAPTEPLPERDPLVYTLSQEDVDEFYRLLSECETLSIAGENMEAIEASTDQVDELYAFMEEQYTIAMILHYCDTQDQTLKTQYLDCVETVTEANKQYILMSRRVYLSDSPAKEELFKDWTEEDIATLLAYEGEVADLQARNEEIEVAYMATSSDAVRIPLYIELVQNNNKIAQIYGYDNYYEYAYDRVYDRDYSPEDLETMRTYAKTYLVPAFETALRSFNNSYSRLDDGQQKVVTDFLYTNYYRARKNYVRLYLEDLPASSAQMMNEMIEVDSTFIYSSKGREGAFTTTIGDRSYCYFGPGYANSSTVVHEAGHYYASRYMDLGDIPLDLAEVHSQGNEWLFVHFLKDHMNEKPYEALVDYRLRSDLGTILICLMIDEFESKVYTTDISNYTAEDFDALMESIATQYYDMFYVNNNLTDINAYWRAVVVKQPVYYISYGVSAIASIDLYTMAVEDYEGAKNAYVNLCEKPDEEKGFQGNLTAAGLRGPFDESFYKDLIKLLNS